MRRGRKGRHDVVFHHKKERKKLRMLALKSGKANFQLAYLSVPISTIC